MDLFDNYGSHWPIFVVLISLIQLGYFVYYVVVVEGIDTLSAYTPVGGPQSMWLQLVSAFPDCESYRAELYRMLTYQVRWPSSWLRFQEIDFRMGHTCVTHDGVVVVVFKK